MNVFIQNEKNIPSRNRYNEETLEFIESLKQPCAPPFPYGFIPGTVGDDGDCIDFWLITKENPRRGEIIDCEVLGLMEFFEGDEEDFKVIGCPAGEAIELTGKTFDIIRDYTYEVFKQFPGVTVRVGERLSAEKALEFINSGDR